MASPDGSDSGPTPGSGVPRGDSAPQASVDALCDWCAEVLRRALNPAPVESGTVAASEPPPLPWHLRAPLRRNGFDGFDEVAIALILAPDLDPVFGVTTSELTGVRSSRYPTISVIADLVGAQSAERVAAVSRLSADGPLARMGLIQVVPPADAQPTGRAPRGPSLLDTCVASTALLRWTFGITQLDQALFPLVRDDLGAPSSPPDPISADVLAGRLGSAAPTLTSLSGQYPADAVATALFAASLGAHPTLLVDARALAEPSSSARVAAEALLRDAVVIVVGDVLTVPPAHWEALARVVAVGVHPKLTTCTVHDSASLAVRSKEQASVGAHLVELLRSRGLSVSADEADRMARWGHLRHEDLGHTAETIAARAAGLAASGRGGGVTARDVSAVTVGGAGDDLARLATPLDTTRDWTELVLPEQLRTQLRELVDQATIRSRVFEQSGFALLPGQPRGVTAVFAGPSGTGKTHAARIVAGELGLPLYAVNLAATVSKYIGETERNLDAVFAAAERTDAVLLFDEAEALFGKRSEVQDARDRYANLEVAFLLQRMERYDGVAVLTTNLLSHFDDAFARRLSFCLYFPFPDETDRRRIWRAVWPGGASPADDVDLDEIAVRYPLSGGHIRNVALAAIHLAIARGTSIDQSCVHRALDREYAKLGRVADTPTRTVA